MTITETDDEYYSAQGEERGVCLILENDEFHPSLDVSRKGGSEVDKKLIENSFKSLGFEVTSSFSPSKIRPLISGASPSKPDIG